MEIKTPQKIHAYAYHICRAWYNSSFTLATKPINFLELHYTMTHFLIHQWRGQDVWLSVSQVLCCFGSRGVEVHKHEQNKNQAKI